jgi:cytochrome P450
VNPNEHPAFSSGPRVCLGKKFSTTESVAFLACFLKEWRIETPMKEGETVEQAIKRLVDPRFGFTLSLSEREVILARR